MAHFEELWEKCEKLHQGDTSAEAILDELCMKINLYKLISEKNEIPPHELQIIKSRTMGEILLTLTNLSLKENIDVYEALSTAWQQRLWKNATKT